MKQLYTQNSQERYGDKTGYRPQELMGSSKSPLSRWAGQVCSKVVLVILVNIYWAPPRARCHAEHVLGIAVSSSRWCWMAGFAVSPTGERKLILERRLTVCTVQTTLRSPTRLRKDTKNLYCLHEFSWRSSYASRKTEHVFLRRDKVSRKWTFKRLRFLMCCVTGKVHVNLGLHFRGTCSNRFWFEDSLFSNKPQTMRAAYSSLRRWDSVPCSGLT